MSHAPSAALKARHDAARREMAARGMDALLVTSLPNVTYLTNFSGSSAIVLLTSDRVHFLTDFRYLTELAASSATAHECPDLELTRVTGAYDVAAVELLATRGASKVEFEAEHLTVARYEWIKGALVKQGARIELVAGDGLVEGLRVRKDDYEVGVLREAARRLSRVADRILASVRRGQTEVDVATAIDSYIRDEGFSRPAFETIVASGPQSALPHARPGERRLDEDDLVVLDFGGVWDSYCVDLTRTIAVGRAGSRAREVHQAVHRAHEAAIAAVAPGHSRFDIDAAARQMLGNAGLGEAFGHGTGHGLGLEVHEKPRISKRRPELDPETDPVTAGMVFTIEPGAYLAGWGGVRIEDDVLVTDSGVEVLTDVTTDLIEI